MNLFLGSSIVVLRFTQHNTGLFRLEQFLFFPKEMSLRGILALSFCVLKKNQADGRLVSVTG